MPDADRPYHPYADLQRLWGQRTGAPSPYYQGTPTIYSKITSMVAGLGEPIQPHHPLLCPFWETVGLSEEGMRCDHAAVPFTDDKVQAALRISICELIIDGAREL